MWVWFLSVLLGLVGLVAYVGKIDPLASFAFWLVLLGLALMLVATAVKGL